MSIESPINACSLRSPDRKRVKIGRAPPTEGGRVHVRENSRHARKLEYIKVLQTLITREPARAIDIKVLTDLRVLRGSARYRHAGPDGPEARGLFGCCSEPARRAAGLMVVARLESGSGCRGGTSLGPLGP